MSGTGRKDLVVLVADKDAQMAIEQLLLRTESLALRPVDAEILVHPYRDSGCRSDAHNFLRPWHRQFDHALVLFDREGCGWDDKDACDTEAHVEKDLERNGWKGRCAVVVISPELEEWVWSDSPRVDEILGWGKRSSALRPWLVQRGFLVAGGPVKAAPPKQAFLDAIREAGTPRSSALFAALAGQVGLERCQDRAFAKLKTTLVRWFGARQDSSQVLIG